MLPLKVFAFFLSSAEIRLQTESDFLKCWAFLKYMVVIMEKNYLYCSGLIQQVENLIVLFSIPIVAGFVSICDVLIRFVF